MRYDTAMRLLTLGGLSLKDASFGRVKPLLLLTYLALEGPQERRYLAQLFWRGASDPMNSLSAALTRLRKNVGGSVEADEVRVWAKVTTDAADLLSALESDHLEQALALYQGSFLHGTFLPDWSVELEEWVYATREDLAERVRRGMFKLAEREAAQGHFAVAAQRAERAHTLDGAPEYEPEELTRLHLILQAGESPLAAKIRDEAQTFDLELNRSTGEARALLQRVLVGRQRESARLAQLAPGDWAWIRGGAGMGKTALLKTLSGTYLPGRSGLPYATLEPLIGSALQEGEAAILQRLLRLETRWLIDNWSRVDEQSKQVLTRLRELRSRAGVVITSRERAPFSVDMQLELGPIPQEVLEPTAWEKTHGLPALVEAYLRNEPLEDALGDRLSALSPEARDAYLALALLDTPDLALVRRALGMEAALTARVLEELLAAGFVEPSGQVRVRQAAQEFLEARPTLLGPLCLKLARVLSDLGAFPLYERSRPLWTQEDEPKAVAAYLAWANELLKRGFPQRAFEVLEDAPQVRVVTFLKARALERAGRYQEAFEHTAELFDTPEVLALKSVLFYRLGKPEAAKAAAEGALEGSLEARAEGMNTLGHQARYRGEYEAAAKYFRRAAALWQAQGSRGRWADALNNIGISLGQQGADFDETDAVFQEALEAAGSNQMLRVTVLVNLGIECERRGDLQAAIEIYEEAIALAGEIGSTDLLTRAWNNLGWAYHQQGNEFEAERAYRLALNWAQQAGEREILGMILGNLAELTENFEAWEEALQILAAAGQQAMIERLQVGLPQNHPFRERSGSSV